MSHAFLSVDEFRRRITAVCPLHRFMDQARTSVKSVRALDNMSRAGARGDHRRFSKWFREFTRQANKLNRMNKKDYQHHRHADIRNDH